MDQQQWTEQIKQDIAANRIMVFAKGEKNMPACGFSHRVMAVLNALGVDYTVRNLLTDETLFDALCDFSDWPTSPQIFIDGKFIGGCDIVEDMYRSGELQKLIGERV